MTLVKALSVKQLLLKMIHQNKISDTGIEIEKALWNSSILGHRNEINC